MATNHAAPDPHAGQWYVAAFGNELKAGRTLVKTIADQEIVFWRTDDDGGSVHAASAVCPHWGGPLGEGKVTTDGTLTCPWHGWQYRPQDGSSPPPFQEKIATYQVRVVDGRVQVNATPLPAGTPTEPARTPANQTAATHA